jgi:hydrogenase/urease accessory protein HupE
VGKLKAARMKKISVLALILIVVIGIAVLWVQQGFDYVIGFILVAGIVAFAGIPLYKKYSKEEHV